MKAAIYVRVSTDEQAGPSHVSLAVQEQRCRAYVADHGWLLVAVERDTESGLRPDRPGYQRVLKLARDGAIDTVVVFAASRFGRKASEVLVRVEELRALGVELVSTAEDLSSFLMLGIQAVINEEETRRILERTMPAKRAKAQQGYWVARAPFGTVNRGGVLQPAEYFDLVRRIYELCADGVSVSDITRRVNAALYPGSMHYANVLKILRNDAYAGVVRWSDVVAPAQWEPLVDPQLIARARDQLTRRYVERRQLTRSYPYWILGLAFCGRCGHRMTAKVHVSRWGTFPYVVCGRRDPVTLLRPCTGKYVRIEPLQDWVIAQLEGIDGVDGYIARLRDRADAQAAARDARRAGLEAERQRLLARLQTVKAAHLDAPETFTIADVRKVEAAVRDNVAAINAELAAPATSTLDVEAIRRFLQDGRWLERRHTDPGAFRDFLRHFIERVVVKGPGIYAITWVTEPALSHK